MRKKTKTFSIPKNDTKRLFLFVKVVLLILIILTIAWLLGIFFGLIPCVIFISMVALYILNEFLNNHLINNKFYNCIDLIWNILLFFLFLGIITTIIFWYLDDKVNEYVGSLVEENFARLTSYPYSYVVNSTEEDKIMWSLYETSNIVKNNVYYSRILMKTGIFTLHLKGFDLFVCGRPYGRNLDNLVFIFNCGACYEYSYVFTYLANKVGLNARQVRNPGGDHNWAEVFYKDKWLPIETTRYTSLGSGVGTVPAYIYTFENNKKLELTDKYSNCLTTFIVKCEACSDKSSLSVDSLNLDPYERYKGRKIPTGLVLNISDNKTFVFSLACGEKTGDYSFNLRDHKKHAYKIIESLNNKNETTTINVNLFTQEDKFNYLLDLINKPIISFLLSLFMLFFLSFFSKKLLYNLKLLINELKCP